MKLVSFKSLRILLLLSILIAVYVYTDDQQREARSWYQPLPVLLLPINGDDNKKTTHYIQQL